MTNPKDTIIASVSRDNLPGGYYPTRTKAVTIAASQTLVRGAVIGLNKIKAGTAAADAGNTGQGAISAYALAAGGPAKIGTYKATFVIAASGGGTYNVTDPDGILIGQGVVGTAFLGGGITFSIADGTPDFIVGDFFNLPVEADTGYGKLLNKAATDGSNKFEGVLLTEAITTGGAETAVGTLLIAGSVQSQALSFYSGTVLADVVEDMRDKNVYVDNTDADENV